MKIGKVREQWNYAVGSWIEFVRTRKDYYREHMNGPSLKRMIGDVKGKKLLDIGCGEGYFSRYFAGLSADVVGIDFSEEMIKAAKKEEIKCPLGVEYYIADAADLVFLESKSFDLAFSFMALMDITDFEAAIGEAYRVLRDGGRFVFVITHPCFEQRWDDGELICGWETRKLDDGSRDFLYLWIKDYFTRHVEVVDWPEREGKRPYSFTTTSYHRTLADYVNTLSEKGFVISRMDEPIPTDEGIVVHPSLNRHRRIPQSITFEAVRMQ
jgi:ubiquinone/menaquinone biosynthesis C-methylase UbiE